MAMTVDEHESENKSYNNNTNADDAKNHQPMGENKKGSKSQRSIGVQTNIGVSADNNALEWHRRLGHVSSTVLMKANESYKLGIPKSLIDYMSKMGHCKVCLSCKTTRAKHGKRTAAPSRVATSIMGTWHVDLIGPFSLIEEGTPEVEPDKEDEEMQNEQIAERNYKQTRSRALRNPSVQGYQHSMTIVDEFARFRIQVNLKTKDEAGPKLIEKIKYWQTQTGVNLKAVVTDGARELISSTVTEFLASQGTRLTVAPPDTPERNPIAERMNQTAITHSKCLINHCQNPSGVYLWCYALDYATYIFNRLPRASTGLIPHKIMLPNEKLNLDYLHTFGCDAHYWVEKSKRGKFQPNTKPGIFVGYSEKYGAYRILTMQPDSKNPNRMKLKVIETLNASFAENSFVNLQAASREIMAEAERMTPVNSKKGTGQRAREFEVDYISSHRRSRKTKQPEFLVHWKGYRHPTWEKGDNLTNCKELLDDYINNSGIEEDVLEFALSVVQEDSNDNKDQSELNDVPQSYEDAINHPTEGAYWRAAIQAELKSLNMLIVFEELMIKGIKNIIDTKWVFAKKHDESGKVVRWKARLVARGFQQQEGIDYTETFSPTVRMKSLKTLLAISAERDYEMKQIDFDTAFLNVKLQEDIYVKPPKGYVCQQPGSVLKLIKAIYGTKQASRGWWLELDGCLKELGYQSSPLDECMYWKYVDGYVIFIALYVDDMIGFFPSQVESTWNQDVAKIKSKYKIKELGDLNWILNMAVKRDRTNRLIYLSQETYIKRVLETFKVNEQTADSRSSKTPHFDEDITIPPKDWNPVKLKKELQAEYRSIIGSLLYAANITRPDIAYITSALSRYLNEPMDYHLRAARRVLEYLYWNPDKKLTFGRDPNDDHDQSDNEEFKVTVYSDSDWAHSKLDRISVGGMAMLINGRIISWQSKKQPTVALSSTEAEYHALTEAVKEALFMSQWFKYILSQSIVPVVYEDNIGAKEMADHTTNHNKMKHIDIRLFFIRDCIRAKQVKIVQVRSQDNIADIFTKATKPVVFDQLNQMIFGEQ